MTHKSQGLARRLLAGVGVCLLTFGAAAPCARADADAAAPVLEPTPAAEPAMPLEPAPPVVSAEERTSVSNPAPRRFGILPVPTLGYAPETRFYAGAVALMTFRLTPHANTRTSNAKVELTLTQNRQVLLESAWQLFLPGQQGSGDDWIVPGYAAFQKYPENIYALGPDAPASSEERYDAIRIEVEASPFRRLYKQLYLGPAYRLQAMVDVTPLPGGLLDQGELPGAAGGLSSGLGYRLMWDTRGNVLTPAAGGAYLSLTQLFFGPALASDYRFSRLELDARTYFRTFPRQVLALQGYAQLHTGNPPFRLMGLLGGERIMRGYYYGRYRGRNLLAVQAEYRLPLFWRFGAVAFAGVGDVADRLSTFRLDSLKHSVGGGIRIRVDDEEQIHLRADYAVGRDSSGFYLGFGEAF